MRPTILPAAIIALCAIAGCGDDARFRAETRGGAAAEDPEERAIRRDIEALAKGAEGGDPEASVVYDKAVNDLILRGAKVETRLIDALRSHGDPWVRLGCVEVLTAIATKASVEHLIAVLDDPAPLVAQRANIALQVITGQRVIAETGKPAAEGQLPAVPERDPADKALDAEERTWAAWHATHKAELKAGWERWWAANRGTFTVR